MGSRGASTCFQGVAYPNTKAKLRTIDSGTGMDRTRNKGPNGDGTKDSIRSCRSIRSVKDQLYPRSVERKTGFTSKDVASTGQMRQFRQKE